MMMVFSSCLLSCFSCFPDTAEHTAHTATRLLYRNRSAFRTCIVVLLWHLLARRSRGSWLRFCHVAVAEPSLETVVLSAVSFTRIERPILWAGKARHSRLAASQLSNCWQKIRHVCSVPGKAYSEMQQTTRYHRTQQYLNSRPLPVSPETQLIDTYRLTACLFAHTMLQATHCCQGHPRRQAMVATNALAEAAAKTLGVMALLLSPEASSADGGDAGGGECRIALGLPLEVRLNNGVSVPRIGFGTAGLGQATEGAVSQALAVGYRHIDTAQAQEWYREEAVGLAVKKAISGSPEAGRNDGGEAFGAEGDGEAAGESVGQGSDGGDGGTTHATPEAGALPREGVFVTTKIHPRDFGAERLRAMVDISRSNLHGVDLLLLHSPFCWPGSCPDNPTAWQEGWRGLEKLYSEGAVRAIGVSNFSESLLRELLQMTTVVPAAVQNWMDPFHQDRAVRTLCAEHGIAYIAYSTLGGQWAYRPSSSPFPNPVSADPILKGIATTHGTSVQAVSLSWALQSGAIILPRSSNPERMRENLRRFVDVDESFGSATDDGVQRLEGGGDGGAAAEQRCETGRYSERDASVNVFLTPEDVRAIDSLDGTIGN
ncbi:unnamed protein product [Scytosiphon promiscuus]